MKTAFVLFVLALGFTVQAAKLSEIDSSSFGHNLMSTVYLEMTTGGSTEEVLELLKQVENEVIQEQADHDARHAEYQQKCSEDQAEYNAQIAKAAADEAENSANLEVAYPLRASLEAGIAENEEALTEAESALEAARQLIKEQREAFAEHSQELIDAISIFNSAKSAISKAFGTGQSLLETSAGASVAAQLKNAKLNAKFEPFARILAQAASSGKLTQSAADQIISLLDRLIGNAQATLSSERQTMQDRDDAFAIYEESLEDTIDHLNGVLADLRGRLLIVNSNIAEWEANLADAQWRFATFTQKLADRVAACEEEDREYSAATTARNNDLSVIRQVEDLVSNHVEDFVQYINSTRENISIQ